MQLPLVRTSSSLAVENKACSDNSNDSITDLEGASSEVKKERGQRQLQFVRCIEDVTRGCESDPIPAYLPTTLISDVQDAGEKEQGEQGSCLTREDAFERLRYEV